MRVAASMSKVCDCDFRSAKSDLVFRCATQNGAKALQRNDIGRIVPGSKADIAIVDMNGFNTIPVRDPIKVLISCGTALNVTDTIVNGNVLMENRQLLSMSREKVSEEAWAAANTIWSRVPNLNQLAPVSVPIL